MSIEKLENGLIASFYGVEPEGVMAIAKAKENAVGEIRPVLDDEGEAAGIEFVEPIVHEMLFVENFQDLDIPEGSSEIREIAKSIEPAEDEDYDVEFTTVFTQEQVLKIVKNAIEEMA